jgi:hypothetical protein
MHATLGTYACHATPFKLVHPKSHRRMLTCALICCVGCEYQTSSLPFDSDTSILATNELSGTMDRLFDCPMLVRVPSLPVQPCLPLAVPPCATSVHTCLSVLQAYSVGTLVDACRLKASKAFLFDARQLSRAAAIVTDDSTAASRYCQWCWLASGARRGRQRARATLGSRRPGTTPTALAAPAARGCSGGRSRLRPRRAHAARLACLHFVCARKRLYITHCLDRMLYCAARSCRDRLV